MANQKIDSIKLSGSTEIYDIDLPKTATPSIKGLTTSYLTVTGSTIISGNPLSLSSNNLELSASNMVLFRLPPTTSTTTSNSRITLETAKFINDNSPCISFKDGATTLSGKIGITYSQGIGLLKTWDGSAGYNTYLTVSDYRVTMGLCDDLNCTMFATFNDKEFYITLSQNLMDDSADPALDILGTLSDLTISFPSDQTSVVIEPNWLRINGITPRIVTSQNKLIAYPGCGYTSTGDYTIPSMTDLESREGSGGGIPSLTSSTLTRSSTTLSGNVYGAVYHIFGFEKGDTGQNPGELRVSKSSTSHTDAETIIVASNDNSWHGDSYVSLTVIVPAGKVYYLWGKNIGDIRYFKNYLKG